MRKLKVAVDLDGVIWDLVTPWVEWYNKKYSEALCYNDITNYNVRLFFTKCEGDEAFEPLNNPYFWNCIEPYETSEEALRKLNDNYELYIATSTSYLTPKEKLSRFLRLFPFIDRDQVIMIHNKKLLDVDYLIDDCIYNLSGGRYYNIIIDTPYNKEFNDGVRVNNLLEAYDYIREVENNDKR